MGTHLKMPSGHGQVKPFGRFQDFAAHVVEGCQVLEYDTLPQHLVSAPNFLGVSRDTLAMS
jgi:hypothetical protein